MPYKSQEQRDASVRRWRENNPGRQSKINRRAHEKRMGLLPGEYEKLVELQHGCCAICEQVPEPRYLKGKEVRSLFIDHDHSCCPKMQACSDCIRGLICYRCNTILGWIEENENMMSRVQRYLDNPPIHEMLQEVRL